jgi:hypothetical protein
LGTVGRFGGSTFFTAGGILPEKTFWAGAAEAALVGMEAEIGERVSGGGAGAGAMPGGTAVEAATAEVE